MMPCIAGSAPPALKLTVAGLCVFSQCAACRPTELTLACLSYLPVPLLHGSPEALPGFSHCPVLPAAGGCGCETGTTVSIAAGVGCMSAACA